MSDLGKNLLDDTIEEPSEITVNGFKIPAEIYAKLKSDLQNEATRATQRRIHEDFKRIFGEMIGLDYDPAQRFPEFKSAFLERVSDLQKNGAAKKDVNSGEEALARKITEMDAQFKAKEAELRKRAWAQTIRAEASGKIRPEMADDIAYYIEKHFAIEWDGDVAKYRNREDDSYVWVNGKPASESDIIAQLKTKAPALFIEQKTGAGSKPPGAQSGGNRELTIDSPRSALLASAAQEIMSGKL